MGLDSVEIVLTWEETFGISLEDSEIAELQTPRQAMELISSKLGAIDAPSFCPGMRAYHVFRSGIRAVTGDPEVRVLLTDRLNVYGKGWRREDFWKHFGEETGVKGFRPPQILFQRAKVRDGVELLVARHLNQLLRPSEAWTRSLVRSGVRGGVAEVVGARDFSDDDRFVEDIGIC